MADNMRLCHLEREERLARGSALLRGMLEKRGWSWYKLARETGLELPNAWRIVEKGETIPSPKTLERIAEGLNATVQEKVQLVVTYYYGTLDAAA